MERRDQPEQWELEPIPPTLLLKVPQESGPQSLRTATPGWSELNVRSEES